MQMGVAGCRLAVLTLCFQQQVLQQELHRVKQDLLVSQQAFAKAQAEQRETDKEVGTAAVMQTTFCFSKLI